MYVNSSETILNHLLRELLTWETGLYVLGTVVFFGVIVLILTYLDDKRCDK